MPEQESASTEAVKHVSPGTERARGFSFYTQAAEGNTDVLREMFANLIRSETNQVSGLMFGDKLVWSNEFVPHMLLAEAINAGWNKQDIQFQSQYTDSDTKPLIVVFAYSPEAREKFQEYLKRNLQPDIKVAVLPSYGKNEFKFDV